VTWLAPTILALLRRSTGLLPADRRVWARALWTEADEVPAGWPRLAWAAGGARFVAREAALSRGLRYALAFAAATAGTAWSAWSGPPGDSAIAINRVDVISIAVILAALPRAIHRARGPAAGNRLARLGRAGGYAAVFTLVLVKAAVERVADAVPNNAAGPGVAWLGEALFLAVMACYAALILAGTTQRPLAVPGTMATGTAIGATIGVLIYALGPLGFPLRMTGWWPARLYDLAMALGALLALGAPVAIGLAAARRASRGTPAGSRARSAAIAGLCTGAAAALVVAVLSTATIALLPYNSGLRNWAADHVGHWTPAVGQITPVVGPRFGYVAGNSAFAAGYLLVLVLGPMLGCGFGAWGSRALGRHHRPDSQASARASGAGQGVRGARHPRPGRPLLAAPARVWAGALLACCAILVAALGALFAHQTLPGRLDRAVDSPIITWLAGHPGLAGWLAAPGSLIPAVALSAVIAVACLFAGRLNGAVLAVAAVPAATGLNDGLLKPLVHRTYLGVLTYPSGHTTTMFALAATVGILLLSTPRPIGAPALRVLIPAAACLLGGVVAVGVIGLRWHYFTDTVAGAALGIGTACGLAILLDLPPVRRRLAWGS